MSARDRTPFTPEQRAALRAAVDQSRREGIEELERLRQVRRESTRPRKPPVVRAAEKAQRAQEAVVVAREMVVERPVRGDRCCLCGDPATAGFCRAHSDLRQVSNGPFPTSLEAAGFGPSMKGSVGNE